MQTSPIITQKKENTIEKVDKLKSAIANIKIFNEEAKRKKNLNPQTGEFTEEFIMSGGNGFSKYFIKFNKFFYNATGVCSRSCT